MKKFELGVLIAGVTALIGVGIWLGRIDSSTGSLAADVERIDARLNLSDESLGRRFSDWAKRNGKDALAEAVRDAEAELGEFEHLVSSLQERAGLLNARVVWGSVAGDGSIVGSGTGGWRATRVAAGHFRISFQSPWRSPPTVIATKLKHGNEDPGDMGHSDDIVTVHNPAPAGFDVTVLDTGNGAGAGHSGEFSFIAIEPSS